jgi:hypothetical protein
LARRRPIVLYIDDALLAALNRMVASSPVSRSELVCRAVERYLAQVKARAVLGGRSARQVDQSQLRADAAEAESEATALEAELGIGRGETAAQTPWEAGPSPPQTSMRPLSRRPWLN